MVSATATRWRRRCAKKTYASMLPLNFVANITNDSEAGKWRPDRDRKPLRRKIYFGG